MVLYGEYLFLENCIAGWIILYFTGRAAGIRAPWWRQALCAAICGGFSFTMLLPLPWAVSLVSEPVFAIGVTTAAFGWNTWKRTVINGALFFLITVFYGGTAMAFLNLFGWQGIAGRAGVYLPRVTYVTVTAAAVGGLLVLTLALELLRVRRQQIRSETKVRISMGGKWWDLTGWIDSGNFLREPLTGRPVALVGKTLMEKMLEGLTDRDARYTVVPYHAVGTENGMLDGWRADLVELDGRQVPRPVLAVWSDGALLTGETEAEILLPAAMLERGIYGEME